MSETIVKTLGIDQIKWLNKYRTINLDHWRLIFINNKPDWVYVGEWKPGNIESVPSKNDAGYLERQCNLESNRYFYWPS
jgi:hypothetical protein